MGKVSQLHLKCPDPVEREPQDDWPISRYVSLASFILHLKGKVFLPSIAKLRERKNDPFESEFPWRIPDFNQAMNDVYGKDVKKEIYRWLETRMRDDERRQIECNKSKADGGDFCARIYQCHYLRFIRNTRFAWCWFNQARESAAMWTIFGLDGVRIGSTVGKLKKALGELNRDVEYRQMAYVDIPEGQGFYCNDQEVRLKPYFLKRKEYDHEKELRFVTTGPEMISSPGLIVELQPAEWIQEVSLSPNLNPEQVASLQSLIKGVLPKNDMKCEQSKLLKPPGNAWEAYPLELCGNIEELNQTSWDSCDDGIPKPLKMIGS